MKKHIFSFLLYLFLIFPSLLSAQSDTLNALSITKNIYLDSLETQKLDSITFKVKKDIKRQKWITAGSTAGHGTALIALNKAWYSQYPRSSFHFYNDNKEWNQIDKIGHGWSAYQLTRASYELWKWSNISENQALLYAGLSGPGFLTVIEILDGFSSKWGFSWGDMAANVGGSTLFIAQHLGWKEQRIQYKFSFHKKNYHDPFEKKRADDLFGTSWSQRMLKDYNAQTYWLSANIHSFFPETNIPKWLNIAVGYSADQMFGGYNNTWIDKNGIAQTIHKKRLRKFYIAPDIDLTKIKTKSKFLHTIFFGLNSLKFPLPSLSINSEGKVQFQPIHF
ncbi:MAG: DUF2279 domain-containing protein [Chitinophagaceae bacterium]|nr:MAG: DUF2279 domain-containing protein [Chitinophagaceae bacterium]